MNFNILLISTWLISPALWAEREREPQDPIEKIKFVDGLQWSIKGRAFYTQYDSIKLDFFLRNATENPINFEPKNIKPGYPHKPVFKAERAALMHTADLSDAVGNSFSVLRSPKIGEDLFRGSLDLRKVFNELKPGTYRCQVIYPKQRFSLSGSNARKTDLASPIFLFTITETTIPLDTSKKKQVYLTTTPPVLDEKGNYIQSLKLHNNSNGPITISADDFFRRKDSLGTIWLDIQTYHPDIGWFKSGQNEYSATGFMPTRVRSGDPILVRAPRFTENGLFRYAIRYSSGDSTHEAFGYSNPFVVNLFPPTP